MEYLGYPKPKTAIENYMWMRRWPKLIVPQHVIKRAVHVLVRGDQRIEALALIRGTYTSDDETEATLDEAREILAAILRED